MGNVILNIMNLTHVRKILPMNIPTWPVHAMAEPVRISTAVIKKATLTTATFLLIPLWNIQSVCFHVMPKGRINTHQVFQKGNPTR